MRAFHYHGSDKPVRVGDRILVHRLLGRSRLGSVVYVPGQVALDPGLGADQWAYRTDDGAVYAVGYSPDHLPHASRRIEFVSRTGDQEAVAVAAWVTPELPPAQPGRDFLALVGCGTLLLILGLAGWLVAARVLGRP